MASSLGQRTRIGGCVASRCQTTSSVLISGPHHRWPHWCQFGTPQLVTPRPNEHHPTMSRKLRKPDFGSSTWAERKFGSSKFASQLLKWKIETLFEATIEDALKTIFCAFGPSQEGNISCVHMHTLNLSFSCHPTIIRLFVSTLPHTPGSILDVHDAWEGWNKWKNISKASSNSLSHSQPYQLCNVSFLSRSFSLSITSAPVASYNI
jgi:hypothetical protein